MKIDSYTGPYLKKTNNHVYIRPAPQLRDMIAHYTITFVSENPVSCDAFHILPDASGCFIFQEMDKLRQDFWGPMREIAIVKNDLNEASERFFVEFLPGGFYQTTGLSLRKFVNMRESMDQLDPFLKQELRDLYESCSTYDELIAKMNAWFIHQRTPYAIHERCIRAIQRIDQAKGKIEVEEIVQKEHVSARQLLRDFEKYIGLTIKEYASIVRFHHTLELIEVDDLTRAAIAGGYFDQAHFNNVFKKITKTNPKRYLENLSDFYKEIYKF